MSLPRGLRNNNPGNIRNSSTKWQGEIQPSKDAAFKQFTTMEWGYRAMFKLLHTYIDKGFNTIEKIIFRWAPPTENNSSGYVTKVSTWTGINKDSIIVKADSKKLIDIVAAISRVENGVAANMEQVKAGWTLLSQAFEEKKK